MWQKKRRESAMSLQTWGVIQLSRKLSWHVQPPDNKISRAESVRILRFADGKYRQATVATIVPLRRFRRFLRKKWLAAARENWKTNLVESRGIPGRDFRCRWLTPLFAKQIKSIFALSYNLSTAVFLLDSRIWIPLRIHESKKCDKKGKSAMFLLLVSQHGVYSNCQDPTATTRRKLLWF